MIEISNSDAAMIVRSVELVKQGYMTDSTRKKNAMRQLSVFAKKLNKKLDNKTTNHPTKD